jgi:hypothetical protein
VNDEALAHWGGGGGGLLRQIKENHLHSSHKSFDCNLRFKQVECILALAYMGAGIGIRIGLWRATEESRFKSQQGKQISMLFKWSGRTDFIPGALPSGSKPLGIEANHSASI